MSHRPLRRATERPSAIIVGPDKPLNSIEAAKLRDQWEDLHRSGSTPVFVLGGGLDYKVAFTPLDILVAILVGLGVGWQIWGT